MAVSIIKTFNIYDGKIILLKLKNKLNNFKSLKYRKLRDLKLRWKLCWIWRRQWLRLRGW